MVNEDRKMKQQEAIAEVFRPPPSVNTIVGQSSVESVLPHRSWALFALRCDVELISTDVETFVALRG